MPHFRLCWTEVYSFENLVEANSLEEAIEKFKQGEVNFPNISEGQYIDDSAELNMYFINEINDPVTGIKNGY